MIKKGQKVNYAYRYNEHYNDDGEYLGCEMVEIPCIVLDVSLNDIYFHEKHEPMFFEINLSPIDISLDPEPEYYEKYDSVPLEYILKYE